MTECYSARCQQDRKLARREFNKWTKNLLLQVGFETITKSQWNFDANLFPNEFEQDPIDFNPNETCLFCQSRKELCQNKKEQQINFLEEENLPLDLSLKSTTNIKHPSMSDIPPVDDFDRFMSDMIASQLGRIPSQPYMNLFPNDSLPVSQDIRIAQLAKQMAYERMLEEIQSQRHPITNKKLKTSSFHPSILTESIQVNHLLNDVMMKILHEMFDKQQPRASHKGELLFVKKQNINNDEQYTKKTHTNKNPKKINPSSSSSSSVSSVSSISSSSKHKNKSLNYNSKSSANLDGKQIRPKRGQYRKYETEQLTKAVAAVLSNEMSVHKAGSYFGVPHSTLEYKVKERNTKVNEQ